MVFRILLVDNAERNVSLNITASFDFVLKPDCSSKYIENSQSLNIILNVLWYLHVSQSSNRTYTPLKMRFHENFIPTHTFTCVHTTLIYPTRLFKFYFSFNFDLGCSIEENHKSHMEELLSEPNSHYSSLLLSLFRYSLRFYYKHFLCSRLHSFKKFKVKLLQFFQENAFVFGCIWVSVVLCMLFTKILLIKCNWHFEMKIFSKFSILCFHSFSFIPFVCFSYCVFLHTIHTLVHRHFLVFEC